MPPWRHELWVLEQKTEDITLTLVWIVYTSVPDFINAFVGKWADIHTTTAMFQNLV